MSSVSTERIEFVARAMCTADGNDPDLKVYGLKTELFEPQHEGSGVTTRYYGSQWRKYGRQALIFIAAHDALHGGAP